MKRFKQRLSGLLMALGLAAVMPTAADEVVATAAGGWFAVDSRAVKDTTLSGGVIVGGETNLVLQCSPSAWGEAGGGESATITCESAAGSGTIVAATTAGEVDWTPAASSFVNTLTYTSGSVQKTAQFAAAEQVGDGAYARIMDGICIIAGTGDMWSYDVATNSVLWAYKDSFSRVSVGDGVTGVGSNAFAYMRNVKAVEIGIAVTNIGEKAFYHCTYITNLVVGAGVETVGSNAFERCYSLETATFGSKETAEACGAAFKITARITMDGDTPIVDAVPEVVIESWNRELQGKTNLTDDVWIPLDGAKPIPNGFHFFRYKYVLPPE